MRRYADGRPAQDASGHPLRYDAGGDAVVIGRAAANVEQARPLFSERMLSFGAQVMGQRLKIAQAVYDKVAEAAEVYMDNGYSVVTVAKIAQKACLEALEFKAYEAGLLGGTRD